MKAGQVSRVEQGEDGLGVTERHVLGEPVMDHDDIVALLQSGDVDAAKALVAERSRKGGISGQDRQTLNRLIERFQPPESSEGPSRLTKTRAVGPRTRRPARSRK